MTRPDLDAIRARWPEGRLANTDAREDVLALLAYIEELESRVTYTVGETEWAMRIANAEQRALTAEAECIALRRELARLMDDH